ncbi:MAG: FHA domain-containing protein [Planctomycetota bacterium]|nr:FHA domain-containing protein [Planctomycetota bacterium]
MAGKVRKKLCTAGHVMEKSWDVCPYCPRGEESLSRTRVHVGLTDQTPPSPFLGWLVALSGRHRGTLFPLSEGKNIVGKDSSNQVCVLDDGISDSHAKLACDSAGVQGRFVISDLDSTSGTFINGRASRIDREEIIDNDLVRFGSIEMIFKSLPCEAVARLKE